MYRLKYIMSNLTQEYSPNWKDLGSVLIYQNPDFQFRSTVLITEFEECLINDKEDMICRKTKKRSCI